MRHQVWGPSHACAAELGRLLIVPNDFPSEKRWLLGTLFGMPVYEDPLQPVGVLTLEQGSRRIDFRIDSLSNLRA